MVKRSRIVERAVRAPSKVIALVAPAGFGKSFAAREIVAGLGPARLEIDAAAPEARVALARLAESLDGTPAQGALVVENLEALGDDAEVPAMFGRLVRAKGERVIVLLSRPPFPLLNSRAFPPGTHLRLGPDELAFSPEETREACAAFDGARWEEIHALSRGWPFAVLALAAGAAPADLHEYLYNEVIGTMPAALRPVLIAVHAAGTRGLDALAAASARSDASNALAQLASVVPLVMREDGTPALHPLLAGVAESRCVEELAEARRRIAPAPEDADRESIRALDARRAFSALEAGELEIARRLLLPYLDAPLDEPPTAADALLLAAQGYLHALRYQVQPARACYERALPSLEGDGVVAALWASVAGFLRLEGDREGELAALDRADAAARGCEDPERAGELLAHRIYGAWFAGDEIEYRRALDALAEAGGTSGQCFAPFVEAVRASSVDALAGTLTPRWRSYAGLIVASALKDAESIEATLIWVQGEAAQCGDFLGELLALLARALAVPLRHGELQGRIAALAGRLDLPSLRLALETLFAEDGPETILLPFRRRFARVAAGGGTAGAPGSGLRVNVLTGTISRGERGLRLSNRPLALVLTLAILGPVTRERLCELLWPDADDVAAANTLKMCVRRARQQLDDPTAIVYERNLWSLRDEIVVDIVEIERNLHAIAAAGPLPPKNRTYLEAIFEFLDRVRPPEIYNSEGMESVGLRVAKVRHLIVARLGEDALQREDLPAALRYADVLRRWDPADESSYTISIRAYAACGNEAEAYREYRQYSAQCQRELGITPDLSLNELLKQLTTR